MGLRAGGGVFMSKRINQQLCIQCGVCLPECPNEGISETDEGYVIASELCTECYGYRDQSSCAAVCPVDAIEDDPEGEKDEAVLAGRAVALRPDLFPRD
jgi:ferredoxin